MIWDKSEWEVHEYYTALFNKLRAQYGLKTTDRVSTCPVCRGVGKILVCADQADDREKT